MKEMATVDDPWTERLDSQTLRREAEGLIEGKNAPDPAK
jgi:hypothetical protein